MFSAAFASSTNAGTIDFEDLAQGSGSQTTLSADITSGGHDFDLSTNHGHLGNDTVTWMGTTALVTDNFEGANLLTMTEDTGATFNLVSADFAEAANIITFSAGARASDSAVNILVTGYPFLVAARLPRR